MEELYELSFGSGLVGIEGGMGQTMFVWCNVALIVDGRYYPKTCNWVALAFKYKLIVVKNCSRENDMAPIIA